MSVSYVDIAVYGFLLLLALRNIWVIVVRQKEYKNLPILMFYAFSLIAIGLRLFDILWYWTSSPKLGNINLVQQTAKICVGVVQDWITLELAIRIRHSEDIAEKAKKRLRFASLLVFALITLAFLGFSVATIVSAKDKENDGSAFYNHICLVW